MGWYDSKYVEKPEVVKDGAEGRVSCVYSPPSGCGAKDFAGLPKEEQAKFFYYTDG